MTTARPSDPPRFRYAVYLFAAAYTLVLVCLLGYQTLWIDEIMEVLGTRDGTFRHVEELTRSGVGGVPLGWLPQVALHRVFGYSAALARLPSALAAVGAFFVVYFTARRLGVRWPLIPAVLLGLLPLEFRYALEVRPYAQGVLLSALATLLFIQLVDRPRSVRLVAAYTLVLVLGMYSQPFACFTAGAHFLWSAATGRKRLVLVTAGALLFTGLSFIPWYLYAAPLWRYTIENTGLRFSIGWKTPLMLIREISGAGYTGGVVLLALVAFGYRRGSIATAMKGLLLACAVVPVAAVLTVDAAFNYFLAIRQMIFILPPLVILAADGLLVLLPSWRHAVLATSLFALALAVADADWLRRPREDWGLAARVIGQLSGQYSTCVVYAAPDTAPNFALFEPKLKNRICPPGPPDRHPVVLAIPPYTTARERARADALIRARGIVLTCAAGMSTIHVLQ